MHCRSNIVSTEKPSDVASSVAKVSIGDDATYATAKTEGLLHLKAAHSAL